MKKIIYILLFIFISSWCSDNINKNEQSKTEKVKDNIINVEKNINRNDSTKVEITGSEIESKLLNKTELIIKDIDELTMLKKYIDAENRFIEELEKDPNNEWLRDWLGYLYLTIWKKEEAKKYLSNDKISSFNWILKTNFLKKSKELFNEWDIYWAEKLCLDWIKQKPNNKDLQDYLTVIQKEIKNNIPKSINKTKTTLIKINKLIAEKKYIEAETILLNAYKKDPNNEWYKDWIGYLYLTMWKKEEAKKYLSIEKINSYKK